MASRSHLGEVHILTARDVSNVERVLRTSEYTYQRFTPEELPLVLQRYPGSGLFNGPSLHGFLLSQTVNPPSAWIGSFGVSWTASSAYAEVFTRLLEHLASQL